ncbi:class I mannose-6-phosphate isomerase [Panacibacter sp. DH6]|uniref:Class I mannose-6-phosphate isomerase n=1 Tax=Panacibacter microcysteis TaxID=2793269 RepID=A0A931GW85_9BACT|nr:class I mannose-6-phosphate isomerase [Panacibacter microcysteis]MBG9377335.1 class I mannose-6-phosphate isomerase [Panacibacter microcysteis]
MKSNFDKFPEVAVTGHACYSGWDNVVEEIQKAIQQPGKTTVVVAIECYHGVLAKEIIKHINQELQPALLLQSNAAFKDEQAIAAMVQPFVTDDPVFGYITSLELADYFDETRLQEMRTAVAGSSGVTVITGAGATIVAGQPDVLIYADMPRWEIQLRFRRDAVGNLGKTNKTDTFAYKYKHAYFVDWRVCDKHKKHIFSTIDYILDTTIEENPKLITAAALQDAMQQVVTRPFRVVPFFDPGPWGGQWLKEVCDLDRSAQNFAWGFDCVPEENSLMLRFQHEVVEVPSVNVVFFQPQALLGKQVYNAFGDEFPIRFDFLDTMEGGNLSLQVHPLKEYIREKFGMPYTQDESYYFLDAKDEAFVYLGLKESVEPAAMVAELESAQKGEAPFDAEKYVQKWQVRKHDHVSIPAGTVHCSGANTVVLEISATPYIFTFKLWDWGRMGLDGKPRPISLEHGKNVIQWDRTTNWTKDNIRSLVQPVAEGDGWREERTGLDEHSFIETRRHWFTKTVAHNTNGVVNVLNLIEGREAIVESPSNAFEPFVIHYAETFIVPAAVGEYTVRPHGESEGHQCATMKAYVRTEKLVDISIN